MPPLFALILFSGSLLAQQRASIKFSPVNFLHSFNADSAPAVTIRPGDTVETETIDAMGFDRNRVRRSKGGNPLTGPFRIEGAIPGDVLIVRLLAVSLNRDFAFTTDYFAGRSMPKDITQQIKKAHLVKWQLDRRLGLAWPDSPAEEYPHLVRFKVPVSPMIGCIGVAPAGHAMLSFFQGPWGGNLDYNQIKQGATVYLPVFKEGAYFYIGDGHAIQGDGEIAGNALETSMDVRFCVGILRDDSLVLSDPRVEDNDNIIALGTGKDLSSATQNASKNLLEWLRRDYHIGLHEATQVMSTTVGYSIAEIADPNVVVAAKIRKVVLQGLNLNADHR
jgi:acetamidase/formamidase